MMLLLGSDTSTGALTSGRGHVDMNCTQVTISKEPDADRLHREYSWSRRDREITRRGVVYRSWFTAPNSLAIKLFREPHHSDEDIRSAEHELRSRPKVAALQIANITTVQEYGA
jgi:hypothetical protein